MDRRAFIGAIAGNLLAAPLAAKAQSAGKMWRIGVLGFAPTTADMVGPDPKNAFTKALLLGLRELGYVYGQHFVSEPRGAEGKRDAYPGLVADLIRLQVDVIVSVGAALPSLKQATSTIPIGIAGAADPVSSGYAKSLRRPDGNFTGLSFQFLEMIGKRLELLKQLVPTAAPVAVPWDLQQRDKESGSSCRSRCACRPRGSWRAVGLHGACRRGLWKRTCSPRPPRKRRPQHLPQAGARNMEAQRTTTL